MAPLRKLMLRGTRDSYCLPEVCSGKLPLAVTFGIPQTPLRGKAPFLPAWQKNASADPTQIRKWAVEYPACNFGSVAIAGNHFIFEADSPAVRERFKSQGHDFTSRLVIESSPGKGHRYYLSAPGVENIGQNKGEDFSIRANGEQCVSPGSIHPTTGKQYRVIVNKGPLTQPTPDEIAFWNSGRIEKKSVEAREQARIPSGQRNSMLTSLAGKRVDEGIAPEKVKEYIIEINETRCDPPLNQNELESTIFKSIDKWAKKPDSITRELNKHPVVIGGYRQIEISAQTQADITAKVSNQVDGMFPEGEVIPDFEDDMITGEFRPLVDAGCHGTTIPRQYALLAAKAMACSIMTKHKIALEDCESSRSYFIVFGETGTGKGLAFRRMQEIVDASQNVQEYIKIIHAVDSEAGIRDAFFEIPLDENRPILYFIDEIKTLGHKADGKKNPEIVDAIIELANNPTISRTKSKKTVKGAASKTRPDSFLLVFACAQDGEAYATAFPRTKLQGLPDRFIPEYSPKVDAGSLPDVDLTTGIQAMVKLLKYAATNR